MSNPKISVIVPVYNVEKYLSECLDSIVNQTLKDIEIICLNDGSTDNSLSILKEYASKDSRIKIIDKENEGLGYTRKVGLDNANGKYILFCDSDDYYAELTAFEELYNYIEKVKVDVVIFNYIFNNKLKKNIKYISYKYPEKEKFSYLDMENIFVFQVTAWMKIYSKKFFDRYDDWFFPKKLKYEDTPFHYQIIQRAIISYFDKYLYVYRMRPKSIMSMGMSDDIFINYCKIFIEIYKVTKNKCSNIQFLTHFCDLMIYKLSNYQIKKIETIKYLIDTIKQFNISNLFECKNREVIFYIKAALRMTPENYMEYLNKKNLKTKNKEIEKLKSDKRTRDVRIKTLNDYIKARNEIIAKRDEAIKAKNETIAKRDEVIKTKNEIIAKRDEAIKTKNETIAKRDEVIKDRDYFINQKNNKIQKLQAQNKNLHTQTNIQEQQIKLLQNSWSYRIGRLFTYPLSIPLDFYKFIRDYNLLKKSDLFDSGYYLANNEDVKNAKMNPIKHYLKFGWKEGRNPSSKFNNNEYLNKRPDVRVAGICPLVHYLKFGKDEELFFILKKIKNLKDRNKNLEKKLNEKSVKSEQLNRKKSEIEVKLFESTKDLEKLNKQITDANVKISESIKTIEKLNKKVTDLEKFKSDIQFVYNRGINKEKISFEIEKFLNSSESGIIDEKREYEIIVSLTSYPDRMYDIHYCIYSLLTQSLKPNKIILWLGEEQFPNKDKDLPKKLLEFTKHGLTIKYTKDIKQFKKLIPSLKEYPNSIIVTADDDIFYPKDWLEKLYNSWKNNKDCVVCHRANRIKIENGHFLPYNDWERCIVEEKPSFYNFLIGAGGVLYPPNSLYKDVFNSDVVTKITPKSDDVWFWAMAVLNDTKIKIVDDEPFRNLIYVNPEREIGLNDDGALWALFNKEEKNILLEKLINYYPQMMEKLLSE